MMDIIRPKHFISWIASQEPEFMFPLTRKCRHHRVVFISSALWFIQGVILHKLWEGEELVMKKRWYKMSTLLISMVNVANYTIHRTYGIAYQTSEKYFWWFGNLASSPVEVGSCFPWFTMFYTSKRWLGMGFLNHQQYHPFNQNTEPATTNMELGSQDSLDRLI